jgi:hypothetical protein
MGCWLLARLSTLMSINSLGLASDEFRDLRRTHGRHPMSLEMEDQDGAQRLAVRAVAQANY